MTSQYRKTFIQVCRVGGQRQYAQITGKEYQEYKVYLALERLTSQRLITQLVRGWMEQERGHYAEIAQRFREPGDVEEGEGEEE